MLSFDSSELSKNLTECLKHLHKLEDCYMVQEKFIAEFKVFLQVLNVCFNELVKNAKLISSSPSKSKILICLCQILKSLQLFAQLLHKPLYRQGVWYMCDRLRCCVSELRGALFSATAPVAAEDCGGFLRRVDTALQLLDTEGYGAAHDASWHQLINDVVCGAVTIAKIATSLDYNEITAACQGILEVNSNLTKEDPSDSNQLALLTDSMFNGLVSLEERVNIAILRLVLEVFSAPCGPVKRLVRQCGQTTASRSLSDLDPLIMELDAHIERVMLIGQFAVSCCENAGRVREMRCCLASVESVDNYLVPALKALYLTPECGDKRKFAQLLCDHWQDETVTLLSHLNKIIDSTAFTRVVQENVSDLSDRMCRGEATEEAVVKQSWLLYKHLASARDISVDLTQLKQSLCECEAAINKKGSRDAIAKRVRLVVAAVDKVAESMTSARMSHQLLSVEETTSDQSSLVKSIRDIPLDISVSSAKSQYASYRPQWLQRKICEVRENKCTESSDTKYSMKENVERVFPPESAAVTPKNKLGKNVYETPKNTVKTEGDLLTPFLSKTCERNNTLYVRTPRQVVQRQLDESQDETFNCSWSTDEQSDSLALEISDILDNLSSLADTLSSSGWQQPQPSPAADVMKRYFSGGSFDSQWFSTASVSVRTDEVSAEVDTLERIQDLKLVDEKIRTLKLS